MEESESDNKFNLKRILSQEQYEAISQDVVQKIETTVQDAFEQNITQKALFEAKKHESEQSYSKLEEEFSEKSKTLDTIQKQLDLTERDLKELQTKYDDSIQENTKLYEKIKTLEYEWGEFKRQRDSAVDEREGLVQMVERRDAELIRLKEIIKDMTTQLQEATKSKLQALENAEQVESLKISLEYKEKRLDREYNLLNNRIETLTQEFDKQTQELINMRSQYASKHLTLEAELSRTNEELASAGTTIEELNKNINEAEENYGKLWEKYLAQKHELNELYESHEQELHAQKKLAELYKGMADDNKSKTTQLTDANDELQRLLHEVTEQYGDLETKHKEMLMKNLETMAKKDDCINLLKKELMDANELLKAIKEENLENAISKISPCAAAASKLIKEGMTLTQIYTQYATVSEELILAKEENRKLDLYVTTIIKEIEEKAPKIRQERLNYEQALITNETLTKQLDELISQTNVLQSECTEAKRMASYYERDNQQLKKDLSDLGRQVCYLLKSVEEARGCVISDANGSFYAYDKIEDSSPAQCVISKRLVTFSSIEELQENNQKLLAVVRKLSEEPVDGPNISPTEYKALKERADRYEARVNELISDLEKQTKMMDLFSNQVKNYKTLYEQALEGKTPQKLSTPTKTAHTLVTSTPLSGQSGHSTDDVNKLKQKLEETESKLRKLETDNVGYCLNLQNKEQKLTEELESVKSELNDSKRTNTKLLTQAEYHEEKVKVFESNIKTYKKQIQALETKNKTLDEIIAKHEVSITHLQNETLNAQSKLVKCEIHLDNLKQENYILKSAETRLVKEVEALKREHHGHSLLMLNLESIKASFARSESEGKLKLESQLDSIIKECDALRLRLREEQENFKQLTQRLQRETNLAKERMEEEKQLADKARKEVADLRNDVENKNKTIEELMKKLKELQNKPTETAIANATATSDTTFKKIKELESAGVELQNQINVLEHQLSVSKQNADQYSKMASSFESQLEEMKKTLEEERKDAEARLLEGVNKEQELAKKYTELEAKYQEVIKSRNSSHVDLSNELSSTKTQLETAHNELKSLKNEVNTLQKEIDDRRQENSELTKTLEASQEKYSSELVQRSNDLQELSNTKIELNQLQHQINELKEERNNALQNVETLRHSLEQQETNTKREIEELTNKLKDTEEQNSLLHNNIQELGYQISILQAQVTGEDSSLNTSQSSLHESSTEELLQIIKFLRQEKDIAVTTSQVLKSENARMKSQITILEKQLEEAKVALKSLKDSTAVNIVTAAKHSELLRKVQTLSAVTDSNKMLREDKNKLSDENKQLKSKLNDVLSKLEPLQVEHTKMKEDFELQQAQNIELKNEALRWKQRVSTLIERSNMTTPEDWRRLTNERENLAKMYQKEKDTKEQLEEKFNTLTENKIKLEQQLQKLKEISLNDNKELLKTKEENNNLKLQLNKTNQEINDNKNNLTKQLDEVKKLKEELAAKEIIMNDLKSKEIQIRKVARKFKAQFEENVKQQEIEKQKREEEDKLRMEEAAKPPVIPDKDKEQLRLEGRQQVEREFEERIKTVEANHLEKIKELELKVASSAEEAENLKKENEKLKTSVGDKEERAKQVLKSARAKMLTLSEEKNNLEKELSTIKGKTEHTRDESDQKVNSVKQQYETAIAVIEKEKADLISEKERLSAQVNSLLQQVNQLRRVLEKQQAVKPSTSSGPVEKTTTDPPTANIKPIAGPSVSKTKQQSTSQQSATVGPWRSGNDTPFASIRPIYMEPRTAAVLPTSQTSSSSNSQTSSTQQAQVMVPPQQQLVHTTGSTAGEVLSSSPTSSHTDYMPATSSAPPIRQATVAPTLSVGPNQGSDAQSTQELEAETIDEIQQQSSSSASLSPQPTPQQQQPQTALVLPRIELPQQPQESGNQQQSIDQSCMTASCSQANSSNTVTTTQAGLKRPRDVDGDSCTSREEDNKVSPQGKRTRLTSRNQAEVFHHKVSHSSGNEIEYQVPTSSQRDQEDDLIIMVDSEEEGNADEGEVEELDDEPEFEEDNGEAYGGYSREDQEMSMVNFDEGPDIDEENQDNNEVEVIEDSNEVPNQSNNSRDGLTDVTAAVPVASSIESPQQPQLAEVSGSGPITTQPQTGSNTNIVVVSHAASSQCIRTRTVPPLMNRTQQSQLVIPQSYEDTGDDSIVPSTPTLFVPRRSDGFGEAVSSPQVPVQASSRFTFSDPTAPVRSTQTLAEDEVVCEDPGTGRSVPTTPLQASPQEQLISEVGQSSQEQNISNEPTLIPNITVTDETESEVQRPDVAGEEIVTPDPGEPEIISIDDENDGVTSEGEKPPTNVGVMEEGREAEASEPFDLSRRPTGRTGGTARRSSRSGSGRRIRIGPRQVWNEPGSSSPHHNALPIQTIMGSRHGGNPEYQHQRQQYQRGGRNVRQRQRSWR